ncbi:MAG: translation initiation factor IF-6 [Thermoplasmata archaeon]
MPIGRGLVGGSPYLGVFLRVSDRAALVPPSISESLAHDLERTLGVGVERTTVLDSEVLGALVALNQTGIVVADRLDPSEQAALERIAPVTMIRTLQSALGNNILVNDRGALVHPEFSDRAVAAISRALGVSVRRGTLAGLGTVGMAGLATNRGVIVHPKTTDLEAGVAAEVLGVPVHRSTANFGVPVVGACVVANSHGMLFGRPTTPVEAVHLQDGLQLLD